MLTQTDRDHFSRDSIISWAKCHDPVGDTQADLVFSFRICTQVYFRPSLTSTVYVLVSLLSMTISNFAVLQHNYVLTSGVYR